MLKNNKIRIFFITCLLFHQVSGVWGQLQVDKYPVQFSQYMNNYHMLNPASIASGRKLELFTGSQRQLGSWSNYNTYYASVNVKFPFKDYLIFPGNVVGLRFVGDKEGQYIGESRLYLTYTWYSKLTENINFAGGMEFGGINYYAKGTYSSGNRSDANLDANLGVWIFNEQFHVGMAINQIANSELQPFNEVTKIVRFYNLTAGKLFDISTNFAVHPSFVYRLYNDRINDYDIHAKTLIGEMIVAGTGYRSNRGIVFLIGVDQLVFDNNMIEFNVSYNIPLANDLINVNTYEFSLQYRLLPIEKKNATMVTF